MYVSNSASDAEIAVARLTACLVDIEAWLKASRLRLNPTKTQVMWLGSPQQLAKVNVLEAPVSSTRINVSRRVLGVVIDSQLSLSAQMAAARLLQLTVLRHRRRSHEPAAVCPECGCTFGVGRSTVRPHHASATGAAMASSSTSGGFQDSHPALPVTVRHGSSLSGCRLSVDLRRRSSSAAFCHIKDVRCETNLQQLWRQVFCSCRSEAVEQPSNRTATS